MAVVDLTIEDYRESFEGKEDSYQLIDVREVEEFEDVRLPNTVNIPLSELQARYNEITEDKPIILVWGTGGRSQMAGDFLVANGYDGVHNLLEGTMGWVKRNLPTQQG